MPLLIWFINSDGTVLRKRYKRSCSEENENDVQKQELGSKINEEEKSEKKTDDSSSCALADEAKLWSHGPRIEAKMDVSDAAQNEIAASTDAAVTEDNSRRSMYGLLRSRTEDGLLESNDSLVAATAEEAAMASRTKTSAEVHRSSSADVIQALDMVLLRHKIFLQGSVLGPDSFDYTERNLPPETLFRNQGNRISALSTSGGCAERRASSGLVEYVTTGLGCDGRRGDGSHCGATIAVVGGDTLVRELR